MTGVELAIVELGAAVVKAGCKFWLKDAPFLPDLLDSGIGLAKSRSLRHIEGRRLQRFLDECADIVSDRVIKLFEHEMPDLPQNELAAAILAVKDTYERVELTPQSIVAIDLDPDEIGKALGLYRANVLRDAGLSEAAAYVYDYTIKESCAYLANFVRTMPTFQAVSLAELLQRQTALRQQLETVLNRLPNRRAADDFSTDYKRQISMKLDRMELFGVRTSEASRDYPLSVAYVNLRASNQEIAQHERHRALLRAGQRRRLLPSISPLPGLDPDLTTFPDLMTPHWEQAPSGTLDLILRSCPRLLLTGEAGSGKTTLLRWLAVRCAREDFGDELSHLNGLMPFYIRLREYVDRPLPAPEQFLESVGRNVSAEMPAGWVHERLRSGAAWVLIDGIDELPGPQRPSVIRWLRDLVTSFPRTRYVITSRPGAVIDRWPSIKGFALAQFESMTPQLVRQFIKQWHEAVADNLRDPRSITLLIQNQRELIAGLDTDRHLRRLAVNPLLSALLCALNREMHGRLPRSRMEIYEAAMDMLLERRDRERLLDAVSLPLSRSDKTLCLQQIALWFVRNGRSEALADKVEGQLHGVLASLVRGGSELVPVEVLQYLVERSGVVRVPVAGHVDFIHKTFQEYLAGKALMEADAVGELLLHASDDQWREVIVMAAGHGQPRQVEELLEGLLLVEVARSSDRVRIDLLTVACLQTARQVQPDLRRRIEERMVALMPPRDLEVAQTLASAGDFILDLLPLPTTDQEAQATVRVAALIADDDAVGLIASIAKIRPQGPLLVSELFRAWDFFDEDDYGKSVISSIDPSSETLTLGRAANRLRYVNSFPSVEFQIGELGRFESTVGSTELAKFVSVTDLSLRCPTVFAAEATEVGAIFRHGVPDFEELIASVRLVKERHIDSQEFELASNCRDWEKMLLAFRGAWERNPIETYFPNCTSMQVWSYPFLDLRALRPVSSVEELRVLNCDLLDTLDGVSEWPQLRELKVACRKGLALAPLSQANVANLSLEVDPAGAIDLTDAFAALSLRSVQVSHCAEVIWRSEASRPIELLLCEHQKVDGPNAAGSVLVRRHLSCAGPSQ